MRMMWKKWFGCLLEVVRAQPPGALPPLAIDPGMLLNMVNVKPPYFVHLEIESMKKKYFGVQASCSEVPMPTIAFDAPICAGGTFGNYVL